MMNRRKLLKTVPALALPALAAPILGANSKANAAEKSDGVITLKLHTFMAPMSNVWLTMLKPWMEKVERESKGRIRFEGYAAMQMGGTPAQLYDQAKDGVADIVWTLAGYNAGRFPKSEVFELPFMMNKAEATSKALWEYVQTQAAEEFQDTHVLAFNVHGAGAFHSRSKPIKTVADLRGMKVRGPSRQTTKMLGYLGAIPVGMPLPSIPDALSKGSIEACILPWEVLPSVKIQELTRFHSDFAAGVGALYTATFVMAMNKKRYESLPADLQKVIDNNSGLALSGLFGKTQESNDAIGHKAVAERNNAVYHIPAQDAQEFKRKATLVEADWVADMDKRGFDGKRLLNTARTLIEKHSK